MTSPVRRRAGALALSATLTLAALAGCAGAPDDTEPAADRTTAVETPTPTETSAPDETSGETPAEGTGSAGGGTAVPVYFAGKTGGGTALFREFHRVTGDPLTEAAALVDGGTPRDPDYRTLWPGVGIAGVQASDGLLVVELEGDAFTSPPDGMTRKDARLAIQQLVYTLQGVQQARVPVQFLRGGEPTTLFGVDVAEPVRNASQLEVMGLVNVTSPEQGATVSGGTLEASGVASSFEATVPWEVRQGEKKVLDGFATAEGWMDKLYPWEARIDVSSLAPGDYTFVAMTDDPSGGAEGAGPTEDTKDFTLQ